MPGVFGIIQIIALLMVFVANIFMRPSPIAKQGKIPFWTPFWNIRPWFSPLGFWVQNVGWTVFYAVFAWRLVEYITTQ